MTTGRVVAIVQARMGSTRLPGKVLRPLAGREVLGWTLRAACAAASVDEVIVATSDLSEDDKLADFVESLGLRVYRGAAEDVLDRFHAAIADDDAAAVVRLTSDCPLLDPAIIDAVVSTWRSTGELDYVSTTMVRSLPRGLDVELATVSALHQAWMHAGGYHRSHVTSWLYRDDSPVARAGLVFAPDASDLRVTLDVEEDVALLDAVVDLTGDRIVPVRELVELLRMHPEIARLNAGVEQKPVEAG